MADNAEAITVDPNFIAQITDAIKQQGNGKRAIDNHARSFWRGEREPLSVVDAFSEYLMNEFDISSQNPMRPIKVHLYAEEKPKDNVVALNIHDNGPGFPTGVDNFLDVFMQQMGINKASTDQDLIGEAGIGAKIASAYLGGRHHYSWSAGDGEPICNFIVDKDTWNTWDSYEYYENEEPYSGPSFFNIHLSKLNFTASNTINPAKLRDQLSAKFAGCLIRHPNVKIYTCNPKRKKQTEPLTPPPAMKYVDKHSWSGTVWTSGIPAEVSVGLLDADNGVFHNAASVSISRSGVRHFERKESKAHTLLFTKNDGSPMAYQGQLYFRNTVIDIDCAAFESTPIKNDLLWGSEKNKHILHTIGQHPEFKNMLTKIREYNNNRDVKSEKNVSHSYQQRLEKLEAAAALDINDILSDTDITNLEYPFKPTSNNDEKETPKKQRRVTRIPKTKNYGNTPDHKKQPTVKMGGKKLTFKIEWVEDMPGSEHLRGWLEKTSDSFILNVNNGYPGFTDKIKRDEKKEAVYLADTVGHTIQDYRLQVILQESSNVTSDEIAVIQRERDNSIANYMLITVG